MYIIDPTTKQLEFFVFSFI